jgi:glycosyltransferase involved in cell wall biosynthesis
MAADPHSAEQLEVSIVIPCLDEEKTIAICVAKGVAALRANGLRGEVVVSDNGSTDRSVQVATEAGARVVRCPVRGYGAALQYGFEQARGRYLIMGDADDSYDFGLIPRFVEKLRAGNPFVMGSRMRGTIDPGAMPVLNRYLGTPVLSAVLNGLFGTAISDCNCGMRGIERSALLSIGATSPGMEYASEMIVKAAVHGIPIVEVPIDFHRDKRDRPPHLRPWRDGWRHLRLLLWHAPDQTMTFPGLLLLLLGSVLVFSGVGGPFHIAGYLFDIHFMVLGLTLAMLGLPALSMGIAVHALIPERKLRKAQLLGSVKTWFTFDRGMIVAGLFFLPGLACDLAVLIHWLAIHRGHLTPTHTRLALAGALLVAMGFQSAFLALLVGSARSAFAPQIFPPDERRPDSNGSGPDRDRLSPPPPAQPPPGVASAP